MPTNIRLESAKKRYLGDHLHYAGRLMTEILLPLTTLFNTNELTVPKNTPIDIMGQHRCNLAAGDGIFEILSRHADTKTPLSYRTFSYTFNANSLNVGGSLTSSLSLQVNNEQCNTSDEQMADLLSDCTQEADGTYVFRF